MDKSSLDIKSSAIAPAGDCQPMDPDKAVVLWGDGEPKSPERLVQQLDATDRTMLADRVDWIYQRLFSRNPGAYELDVARTYLHDAGAETLNVWGQYVHGLMMLNEFVFID